MRFGEVVIINKSMKKIKLFVIAVVIIAGSLFMWQYVNNFLSKSRAAVDRVDLTLSPKSGALKVGEEKTVVLLIKPQLIDGNEKISGIDLTIAAEGNISILGLTPPAPFPLGSNTNLKGAQLINDVKEKQARIAYVYTNPSNELSSVLQIQLRIKGTAPGSGKLVINKEKTEIAGIAIGNIFELGLVDETSYSVSGQAGPSVTLQISPKTTQKEVGEAFPLTFQIVNTPEGKGISAFTINLSYDKDLLEIISVGDPIDAVTNGDKDKFTQGKKEINQNKGEIILSYLSTVAQDQLPKKPKIEIQVKGKKTGTGEFKIVSAQVTGNISKNEYQTSIENASYDIVSDGGPTNTPVPTGGTDGNVKLNLKLKFQGILGKPADALNKMAVKIKLLNELTETATDYKSADFTADDKGVWSGNTSFNIDVNAKYILYVKGPYHIQKKICDEKPIETADGTYSCIKGNISLKKGYNDVFDLTGIILLVGDLPDQNGAVDAYDISLVRNNLGKTDETSVANSDVNRDGIVDTQDYSSIIAALSIKQDEE